jgi:hypothetical protein
VAAVTAAGLADTLSGGLLTVLAPTDEAFQKLPEGTVEGLVLIDIIIATILYLRYIDTFHTLLSHPSCTNLISIFALRSSRRYPSPAGGAEEPCHRH